MTSPPVIAFNGCGFWFVVCCAACAHQPTPKSDGSAEQVRGVPVGTAPVSTAVVDTAPPQPWTPPANDAAWSPLVRELFVLARRDLAFQELIERQSSRGKPAPVKEVVVCPQESGRPILAVFELFGREDIDVVPRRGLFTLLRADGSTVLSEPTWSNGEFEDLNADGIVDFVTWSRIQIGRDYLEHIEIVPVTEAFAPAFRLYWRNGAFQWRIHRPASGERAQLELLDQHSSVVASYAWSDQERRWLGPPGSADQGFLVQTGENLDVGDRLFPLARVCADTIDEVARALPPIARMFAGAGPDDRPGSLGGWLEDAVSLSYGFHHSERFETLFIVTYGEGSLTVSDLLAGSEVSVPWAARERVRLACQETLATR